MSNYTPGPWLAHPSKYRDGEYIVQAGMPSNRVLASFGNEDEPWDSTDKANARLIASAPDLLNALTGLADACASMGIPVDAARAAIARATQA